MAGSNQSANLSGMLNQIANTLGNAGQAKSIQQLGQNVQSALSPRVDSNDPDSLDRMADYLERTGKPGEAARYRQQSATLRERQGKTRAQSTIASVNNAMLQTINDATLSPEVRSARMSALQQAANNAASGAGLDPTRTMNMGQRLVDAQIERDITASRQQAMQQAEVEKKEAEQINQVTAAIIDQHGIDSPEFQQLKEAPLLQKNRDIIQNIESREIRLENERQARAEYLQEQSTPPSTEYMDDLLASPLLDDEQRARYQGARDAIVQSIANKEDGKWSKGEKAQVLRQIGNLERGIGRTVSAIESANLVESRAVARYNRQLNQRAATVSADKWEVEPIIESIISRTDTWRPGNERAPGDKLDDKQLDIMFKDSPELKEKYKDMTVAEIAQDLVVTRKQEAILKLLDSNAPAVPSGTQPASSVVVLPPQSSDES